MTTKLKNGVTKSSREQAILKAYRQHQSAIQSALNIRRAVMNSEVVTLRSGQQLRIAHTSQGYQVVGVVHE